MSTLLNTQITNSEPTVEAVQAAATEVSDSNVTTTTEDIENSTEMATEADLEPTQADKDAVTPDDDGIINIDISPIKKKRFSINGDMSNMLELNIADVNIVQRLNKSLKKLNKLQQEAVDTTSKMGEVDPTSDEGIEILSASLEKIDNDMRALVDYIFNAEVSKACARDGSMYDMFKGAFRYEHIIETLMKLYESNIKVEYQQMRSNLSKHTSKYTKSRKR